MNNTEVILFLFSIWFLASIFIALGNANNLTDMFNRKKSIYIYHIPLIIITLPTIILWGISCLLTKLFQLKIM